MRVIVVLIGLAMLQGGSRPGVESAIRSPQSSSLVVRIDVIAADARGRVVDNLRPADFIVRDEGVVQPVESAPFLRPTADDGRLIALFLDEYHVSAEATTRVREAVARLVDQLLAPEDMLVVMKPLDSLFTIKLTRDRDLARAAIESFEGRRGDYAPRNNYERNFMAGVPQRIEKARTQVALSAINALAVHFAAFTDRRKTLIVVSEGMAAGEQRRGLEYLPTTETIVRSAQRANVAIYTVDPAQHEDEADTIPALAAATNGRATFADLDGGLRQAINDASGYYLLTYHVQRPEDGRFHEVQVQVKRSDARLRARTGYFAPSPDDALRATLLAQASQPKPAVPLEPAPHTSPLIRPWFGTSRGENGKTRVTFVWEPAARLTGERVRHVPARVVLSALAADNSVLFEGAVNATGPALIDDPATAPSRAIFDVTPGRLRLRMSIQDVGQQVLDSDVRSITIRDMRSGVLIGTPEVLRARNAREFRALDTRQSVPVASREFSRAERLLVRFFTYPAEGSPLSVSARLLSRMGPMRDLPITTGDGGINEIDLSLAGLAVGEYVVEVSASGTSGSAKDVVDFHVTT